MGWLDDLANKVGISSKALDLNTAADKAAREKEAQDKAYADAIFAEKQAQQAQQNQAYNSTYDESREMANIYNQQTQQPGILSQAYDKALKGLGGVGSVAGNILGNKDLMNLAGAGATYFLTKDQRDAAEKAQNEATNLAKQAAYLQDPAVAQIQDDAQNKAYLAQATKGLADRAAMGLTPEDLAEVERIRNEQNQTFQAQQQQVQENMARRGMGNSGLALAQTMGASQAAGQQAAKNASDLSAQMFQAKQNALGNLANTASQSLTGQFNRDVSRGTAKDQVSQFNTNVQNKATDAQREQALKNVQYQQQAAQNKAKSLGDLTQAGSTYLNNAFGQKK